MFLALLAHPVADWPFHGRIILGSCWDQPPHWGWAWPFFQTFAVSFLVSITIQCQTVLLQCYLLHAWKGYFNTNCHMSNVIHNGEDSISWVRPHQTLLHPCDDSNFSKEVEKGGRELTMQRQSKHDLTDEWFPSGLAMKPSATIPATWILFRVSSQTNMSNLKMQPAARTFRLHIHQPVPLPQYSTVDFSKKKAGDQKIFHVRLPWHRLWHLKFTKHDWTFRDLSLACTLPRKVIIQS